jgi:FAD:protein FMN transferase
MNNRIKNILYGILLLLAVFLVRKCREGDDSVTEPIKVEGQTMGTTYHVTYFDEHHRNFKVAIDSILVVVNKSINNYDPASEVSHFNKSRRGIRTELPYLFPPILVAQQVYAFSNGAFDPTVMPLVNAWGFGPGKRLQMDSARVDSLRQLVGLDKITIKGDSLVKSQAGVQLDFGGIGQGYGADVITDFLKSKGIANMLVELGGEGNAIGKNLSTNKAWEIGILDPNSTYDNQFFKAYVSLSDQSFTTSGNYFNFHEENGVKYSHTIDPTTGYPARKAILSASVFTKDCTLADAWGTALMVVGHEEAMKLADLHPELDILIMYSDEKGMIKTFATQGLSDKLRIN